MKYRICVLLAAMAVVSVAAAQLIRAQSFPSEITLQHSNENRYFPLHIGKYWKWDTSAPGLGIRNSYSEEAVVKDLGSVYINGTRNFRDDKIVSAVATVYRTQRGSVYTTEKKTDVIGGEPVHTKYEEPCLVMPDRPVEEMVWTCETTRMDSESGEEQTITDNYTIITIEDVKIEAGHYHDCVKINQVRTVASQSGGSRTTFNKWYCRKIGLTKVERDGTTTLELIDSKDVEVEIQEEETPAAEAPAEAPAGESAGAPGAAAADQEDDSETLSLEEQAAMAEAQYEREKAAMQSGAETPEPAGPAPSATPRDEPSAAQDTSYDIVNLPPYPDPAVPAIGIIGWSEDQRRIAYLEILERGGDKPVRTAMKIVEVANNDVVWNYTRRMCGGGVEGCSAGDIVIEADDVDYRRIILLENRDALSSFNIGSDSGYVYVIPEEDGTPAGDSDDKKYFALVLSPSKKSVFTLLPGGGRVSGDEIERGWQYVAGGAGAWQKEITTEVAQAPPAADSPEAVSAPPAEPAADEPPPAVTTPERSPGNTEPAESTAPPLPEEKPEIESPSPAEQKTQPGAAETTAGGTNNETPAGQEETAAAALPSGTESDSDGGVDYEAESMASSPAGDETEKEVPAPPPAGQEAETAQSATAGAQPAADTGRAAEPAAAEQPAATAATAAPETGQEEIPAGDDPDATATSTEPEPEMREIPEEEVAQEETPEAADSEVAATVDTEASDESAGTEAGASQDTESKSEDISDRPAWMRGSGQEEEETAPGEPASWVNRMKPASEAVPEKAPPPAAVPSGDEIELQKAGQEKSDADITESAGPAASEDTKEPGAETPAGQEETATAARPAGAESAGAQPGTDKPDAPAPPEQTEKESLADASAGQDSAKPRPAATPAEKKDKPKEPKCPEGMTLIPAGKFTMGCSEGDGKCENSEKPPHRVEITQPFCMDTHEVTQQEFQEAAGRNPSDKKDCGSDCPVESVTWEEASAYCKKTGGDLPTEAQWEYAARAGSEARFYWGDEPDKHGTRAWSWNNSMRSPHRVGLKIPNEFGLYDMAGNVWEWTRDCYSGYNEPGAAVSDPFYTVSGCDERVIRGGSWVNADYNYFRVSKRNREKEDTGAKYIGFRCIREPAYE